MVVVVSVVVVVVDDDDDDERHSRFAKILCVQQSKTYFFFSPVSAVRPSVRASVRPSVRARVRACLFFNLHLVSTVYSSSSAWIWISFQD